MAKQGPSKGQARAKQGPHWNVASAVAVMPLRARAKGSFVVVVRVVQHNVWLVRGSGDMIRDAPLLHRHVSRRGRRDADLLPITAHQPQNTTGGQ